MNLFNAVLFYYFFSSLIFIVVSVEDLYETLGVNRRASSSEIRRAYRQLAKEWHPDKNKDPEAGEKFTKINEAYETLMDSERRDNYDRYGHTAANQGQNSGPGRGFQGFESFFSQGSPFGGFNFKFNFGDDSDANLEKYRVTPRDYEERILAGSNNKPYIMYAYRDFCYQCGTVEQHWDNIVHDMEFIGLGLGAVNVQLDRRLTSRLRISSIPSIVAIIDGKMHWMKMAKFDMQSFRKFVRSLFDPSHITPVETSNINSFLSDWRRDNKVRVLFCSNKPEPTLRFLVAAFWSRQWITTGYLNTQKTQSADAVSYLDISTTQESLFIFKEDEEPKHFYEESQFSQDFITSTLTQNKYLDLPRLSSQRVFDELCPANSPRRTPKLCVVLLSSQSMEDQAIQDSFRHFASQHTSDRVRFVYSYEETQAAFVGALTHNTGARNDTLDSLKVVIIWRKEDTHILMDHLEDGWSTQPKQRTRSRLTTLINQVLQGTATLPVSVTIPATLVDEHQTPLVTRVLVKLLRWCDTLQETASELWYHMDEVSVVFLVTTLTFMIIIGLSIRSGMSTDMPPQEKRPNRKQAPSSTSTAEQGVTSNDTQPTVYMHPLCQESFGKLITDLPPGVRTIVVLIDKQSQHKLLTDFATIMYPHSRARAFSFAFLSLDTHLSWYRSLLETVLDFRQDLQHINCRNCVGTVLAINGYRKSFSVFHASKPQNQGPSRGGFMGMGESSDSEGEGEVLFHGDLLKGLGSWMERLCEGSVPKLRVDYWPSMESL